MKAKQKFTFKNVPQRFDFETPNGFEMSAEDCQHQINDIGAFGLPL